MGEFVMRGFVFGDHRLALIAIIAGCGTGNQHAGRSAAGINQFDQLFGQIPAAVAQAFFLRFAPALVGDRLTGQVDYGVKIVQRGLVLQR
ncbi:hypothetical protein D3C75_1102370 [compost metagenome]